MAGSRTPCPNCGGRTALLRIERQETEGGAVMLHWSTCVACRHVRLDHWAFADRAPSDHNQAKLRAGRI